MDGSISENIERLEKEFARQLNLHCQLESRVRDLEERAAKQRELCDLLKDHVAKLELLHSNTHGPHGHVAINSRLCTHGDWTSLESVEIGDTIGGVKIEFESQKDLIRSTGQAIRVISTHMDRRKG